MFEADRAAKTQKNAVAGYFSLPLPDTIGRSTHWALRVHLHRAREILSIFDESKWWQQCLL